MARHVHKIFVLHSNPLTFVYTTSENKHTLKLLDDLGFKFAFSSLMYGFSDINGPIFSLEKYFDIRPSAPIWVRMVRINNDTELKIKEIYKEICDAQTVARKRWWEYYRK